MKRFIHLLIGVLIGILAFLLGISSVWRIFKPGKTAETKIQSNLSHKQSGHQFRHIRGGSFQSFEEGQSAIQECLECKETGDVRVFYNTGFKPGDIEYILQVNCGNFIVRIPQLNEKGQKIGERCVIHSDGREKIF